MNYVSKIVIAHSEDGDWEAAYADGRLVIEDHRLDAEHLLKALGFDVQKMVFSSEQSEVGMPNRLSDIVNVKFLEKM